MAERADLQLRIVTDSKSLLSAAQESSCGLLHDHGQWIAINRCSANVSRLRNIPRIVSPRGMLSPWSLNHRWFKKKIAWHLYAGRDLAQAAVIHATSELERQELRELGVRQPIAVIPNGVDPLPNIPAEARGPERPYVLFLSRIHQKKGVSELLSVWRDLKPRGWGLVLAGPDEQGLIARATLPPGVRYVGMVDGLGKAVLMRQASLFVLPTYSENFGVVVAESLMAGVPVITTHGAPWECLVENDCGWWIPTTIDSLRDTLLVAMSTPESVRKAMGQRGVSLMGERFAWPSIAKDMITVYDWILGGGTPPSCVEL
jgi:glycosyltransferase involved in cell wall biosynthesis